MRKEDESHKEHFLTEVSYFAAKTSIRGLLPRIYERRCMNCLQMDMVWVWILQGKQIAE